MLHVQMKLDDGRWVDWSIEDTYLDVMNCFRIMRIFNYVCRVRHKKDL